MVNKSLISRIDNSIGYRNEVQIDPDIYNPKTKKGFESFCDDHGKAFIESAGTRGDNLYDLLVERFNQSSI